jgi:hypothetical protein
MYQRLTGFGKYLNGSNKINKLSEIQKEFTKQKQLHRLGWFCIGCENRLDECGLVLNHFSNFAENNQHRDKNKR